MDYKEQAEELLNAIPVEIMSSYDNALGQRIIATIAAHLARVAAAERERVAAPDLLAACELLLAKCESFLRSELDGTTLLDAEWAEFAPARAAIAKARGEGE